MIQLDNKSRTSTVSAANVDDAAHEIVRLAPLEEGVTSTEATPEEQARNSAQDAAFGAKQNMYYHDSMMLKAQERRQPDGTWAPEDAELGEYMRQRGEAADDAEAEVRAKFHKWRQDYRISTRKAEEIEADVIAVLAENDRSRGRAMARMARERGEDVADPDESVRNPLLRWYRAPAHEADPEFRWSSVEPREAPPVTLEGKAYETDKAKQD